MKRGAAAAFAVLAVAILLRAPDLQLVPHITDESGEVMFAWDIAYNGARPLVHTDSYNGPLWPYLLAGTFRAFGPSPGLPRRFALFLGLATVVAAAVLGGALSPPTTRVPVGIIAGATQATNFTHALVGSRIAWSNASTPLWTALATMAVVWAAHRGGVAKHLVAGLLAGLALQTHPSVVVYLIGLAVWYVAFAPVGRPSSAVLDDPPHDHQDDLVARTESPVGIRPASTNRGVRADVTSRLRRPEPWAATGAALLAYAPVVVYNLRTGFDTLAQAEASRNVVQHPGFQTWIANVGHLLAQLGRSLAGGFTATGIDAAWIPIDSAFLLAAAAALVWAALRGCRMPLVVCAVCVLGLPLVNENWQGFFEARYLGFLVPLIGAAAGIALVDLWTGRGARLPGRLPARLLAALILAVAMGLPALRVTAFDREALSLGRDNRTLLDMAADSEAASAQGAEVVVESELKQVAWDFGGQPRRAAEYYLTLGSVPYEEADRAKINHFLSEGRFLELFLTADTYRAMDEPWSLTPVIEQPSEGWGLYRSGSDGLASP